ncbi:hypothetical protein FA132_30760 [Pseudomonas aeruginosa]|nr:hypothetical protein [Pseudomonas aeruginosa]
MTQRVDSAESSRIHASSDTPSTHPFRRSGQYRRFQRRSCTAQLRHERGHAPPSGRSRSAERLLRLATGMPFLDRVDHGHTAFPAQAPHPQLSVAPPGCRALGCHTRRRDPSAPSSTTRRLCHSHRSAPAA